MKIMRFAPLENARWSRPRPSPARRYQVGASLRLARPADPAGGRALPFLHQFALSVLFWIGLLAATPAANWYVATNGTGGGTSWADAINSIQGAINASAGGDTVWVSNGVYEVGGITNYPTGTLLTNRVAIYKAITVRSTNGPAVTTIKGAWDPTSTNGPAAVRCVWMTNGSALIGFTLTNGATLTTGSATNQYGGGVYCQSTNTVISNCVLTGNSAYSVAGGVFYGTLFNCTLTRNSATYAGGTYVSTLFNCTLTSNSAVYYGGGSYYGTLSNCTLTGNSAARGGGAYGGTLFTCTLTGNSAPGYGGGGAYESTLSNCTLTGNSSANGGGTMYGTNYNCTIVGNSASDSGGTYATILYNCTIVSNSATTRIGGAKWGSLFNCTIVGNSGPDGGGTQGSTLYNCTVVSNSSSTSGGGVNGGTLINCIVYFNSATTSGSNWYAVVAFTNTCTAPAAPNGVGNITSDPLFVDRGAGDYHLSIYSPALNAGTNYSWMTVPTDVRSKDLDGLRRIDQFSRQVDMGCYELMPRGTLFIIGK